MAQYLSPGVYIEEKEAGTRPIEGVATAIAAFVGLAEQGPFNTPTLVTNWTQFTNNFGGFLHGSYLAHAVYGYFLNGGGSAYIVRVGADGKAALPAAKAELATASDTKTLAYQVQALEGGPAGNDLTVEVAEATTPSEDTFQIIVKRGDEVLETFDGLTTKRGRTNAATVVNAQSKLIRLEEATTGGVEKPATGSMALHGGKGTSAPPRIGPDDYVGNSADRTGFGGLEAIEEVTMVAVPDLSAAYEQGMIDLEGFQTVQLAMIAHCELMNNRMAILDPPPGMNPQQIKEWRVDKASYDSKFATLYWPRIKVFDPPSGQNVFVPPSGHVAGLWARTDGTRGVHKAPANDILRGAVDLECRITKSEHDVLNPVNINCIRVFPGRGLRVWGARTLSSDPAWRYVNVRRLFNFVEQSILGGTQWVVFEPNDQHLWGAMKRTVNAFLYRVWLDGALFGVTPDQAFYVKCDDETNPQEVIEAGQVVCEIGIAPVKPAEFVVFRLAQLPAGTSAINE